MRPITKIIVHCSATTEDTDYTFERLIADHKARGFHGCGYHRYVRRDGTRHIGRPYNIKGAHAGEKYNADSLGICYEGGVQAKGNVKNPKHHKDTRTPVQRAALLEEIIQAVNWIESKGWKVTEIMGHRDISPDLNGNGIIEPEEWIKSCPCFDAIPEYKYLIK